jgi:hypothetical protein
MNDEPTVNFITAAFRDVMQVIGKDGALDELEQAVRSNRAADALTLIAGVRKALDDRVVWVVEYAQFSDEMMELGDEFDEAVAECELADALKRLQSGQSHASDPHAEGGTSPPVDADDLVTTIKLFGGSGFAVEIRIPDAGRDGRGPADPA